MDNNNKKKSAFSFKNMTAIQKKSLLKLLGILALIIAIFTIFLYDEYCVLTLIPE